MAKSTPSAGASATEIVVSIILFSVFPSDGFTSYNEGFDNYTYTGELKQKYKLSESKDEFNKNIKAVKALGKKYPSIKLNTRLVKYD